MRGLYLPILALAACTGPDDTDTAPPVQPDPEAVYVAPDGDDRNPGTRHHPMRSIDYAVFFAEGREVRVAGGTYREEVHANASIEGGYDPADWTHRPDEQTTLVEWHAGAALSIGLLPDDDQDPTVSHLTVRGGTDRLVAMSVSPRARHVLIRDVTVEAAATAIRLDGAVTLERVATDGRVSTGHETDLAIVDSALAGLRVPVGAVTATHSSLGQVDLAPYLDDVTCSADLEQVTMTGLQAGQVDMARCTVEVRNSLVQASDAAGAPAFTNTDLVLLDTTVSVDAPSSDVQALSLFGGSTAVLVDNRLTIADTTGRGVGIAVHQASGVAAHNVVHLGAGEVVAALEAQGALVAINNAFVLGPATDPARAVADGPTDGRDLTLLGNAFTGATCLVDGCPDLATFEACAWAGCTAASGNLEVADPAFADPAAGDYHIAEVSPLRDAGVDPTARVDADLVGTDPDGDPRPQGAGWDIGVDEVPTGR